jgi:hypothetical protein
MTNTPPASLARTFRLTPFFLALVCFALPFLEVSCQGQKAMAMTGIQLATGTEYQQTDPFTGQPTTKKIQGEQVFLAALGGTGLALLLCFSPGLGGPMLGFACGLIDLGLLIGGKLKIEGDLVKQAGNAAVCNWQLGFWAACLFLGIGIIVCIKQLAEERNRVADDKAPEVV